MKKKVNQRNYNIYFHTHTISGIIISAILYVIFFAGSFAFFRTEISNWQKNTSNNQIDKRGIDFGKITDSLNKEYKLYGRDVSYYLGEHSPVMSVSVSESKDTTNKKEGGFFYVNTVNKTSGDYETSYDLGEFLYRLHFLAQLNSVVKLGFPIGYYISGGVAFIFLFALITGLLLHWKKIISNFHLFRPWEKLKTVWTDLHTALGVISFPFLFVFAVTGTYYLVSYPLVTQPTAKFQYAGNEDTVFARMGFGDEAELQLKNASLQTTPNINELVAKGRKQLGNIPSVYVELKNYGDKSMQVHISGSLNRSEKFISSGEVTYRAEDGKLIQFEHPDKHNSYADVVRGLVYTLHFGNFGGYPTKILYFLLGICGCVVIISGVLIWLLARDKKNIPKKKRIFNEWTANIFLAICLSMFPVTATTFIAVKLNPDGGMDYIYRFYFWCWLMVSVLLVIRKNIYKTNRDCMLAGSLIGALVPVVNGVVTGNWPWHSYANRYHDILIIDVFWIFVSIGGFICWLLIVKKQKSKQAAISGRVAVA